MIPQSVLLLAILHIMPVSYAQAPAALSTRHAESLTSDLRVLEAGAKATLEKNSIRVARPLSAPPDATTRVIVWLASPKDQRTAEITASFSANRRQASAVLPWPITAHGTREEDLGWYRICYRVEQNGAVRSHGVLSVGAITANLMGLRLAYPKLIARGHALSARVVAVNPVTERALSGVSVKASLTGDELKAKKTVVSTAVTGRNGEAILTLPPLGGPGDTLDLAVKGTLQGPAGELAQDSVTGEVDVMDRGRIAIETDKPLHKPGETVHLRALSLLDSGRASAGEPVTVTITDPDNQTLAKAALKTNSFGIASYDWKTSEQLVTGDYEVAFSLDKVTGAGGDAT